MTSRFKVQDATCGHCKGTIEGSLGAVEGVERVEMDIETHILTIEHKDSLEEKALGDVVVKAGYTPEVIS